MARTEGRTLVSSATGKQRRRVVRLSEPEKQWSEPVASEMHIRSSISRLTAAVQAVMHTAVARR
eukprot:4114537-Prymnesium_polylepis.1